VRKRPAVTNTTARLFDRSFIDSLPTFDKYTNPRVVAMCRRSEPSLVSFREQFESWFQRMPASATKELAQLLRSTTDADYLSGFYEVVLHEYFRQRRWSPRRHAKISGMTPDLIVRTRSGQECFVEITVPHAFTGDESALAPFYDVLRAIDELETPFGLVVHLRDWPRCPIDREHIKARVAAELNALPARDGVAQRFHVREGGMTLVLSARFDRGSAPATRSVRCWSPPAGLTGIPVAEIKTAIRRKIKKYRILKTDPRPFLVALCGAEIDDIGEMAIDEALYGDRMVAMSLKSRKMRAARSYGGLVTPSPGLLWEAQNRRLSAVMLCTKCWNGHSVSFKIKVLHNPWALKPLSGRVFAGLPQLLTHRRSETSLSLRWSCNDGRRVVLN